MAISFEPGRFTALLELAKHSTGANDASLWVPSEDGCYLVMIDHTGEVVGKDEIVRQPMGEGVVSEVFKTGRLMEDTGIYRSKSASRLVDMNVSQQTVAMIAAPVFREGEVVAVLSLVQIVTKDKKPESWGLRSGAAEAVKLAAEVIQRLG